MSVAAHFSMAPINPAVGPEQFRADVEQVQATCILTTPDLSAKLALDEPWVAQSGITIVHVDFSPWQELALTYPDGTPLPVHTMPSQPNRGSDMCLMLFTSGTSGKKKIVPLSLHQVVVGAMQVIDSWGLTPDDVCLNMMPLFHV
ncbi:MAG: AMP-binding protein [Acidobacteria bacterium]|nr:AMP-binding protein [Acidobacteriota bacterium]